MPRPVTDTATRPWNPWFAGVVSGLLLIAAFPPLSVPGVAGVALVPLLIALRPSGRPGRARRAVHAGLAFGWVFFGIELHWMAGALWNSTRLAIPITVGAVLLGGVFGALATRGAVGLHRRGGVPWGIAFVVAFVVAEWLRGTMPALAFPWLGIATALGSTPAFLAPAAWVGEHGLAAAVVGANVAVAAVVLGRVRVGGAVLVALGLGWAGAYAWTISGTEDPRGAMIDVAVITTRVGKADAVASEVRQERLLASLQAVPSSVALVLTPEASIAEPVTSASASLRTVADQSARIGAPVVLGAPTRDGRAVFNSTLLIDGSGGFDAVHKSRLVPVVEWGYKRGTPAVLVASGPAMETADSGGPPVGTLSLGSLVCFESLFAGVARRAVHQGAQVLVAPTSEAWFSRWGGWARLQHPEHLRLRAVETGRWGRAGRERWGQPSRGTGRARSAIGRRTRGSRS